MVGEFLQERVVARLFAGAAAQVNHRRGTPSYQETDKATPVTSSRPVPISAAVQTRSRLIHPRRRKASPAHS